MILRQAYIYQFPESYYINPFEPMEAMRTVDGQIQCYYMTQNGQ